MPLKSKYYGRKYSARTYRIKKQFRRFEAIAVQIAAVIVILIAALLIQSAFMGSRKKISPSMENVAAFRIPIKTMQELAELSYKYRMDLPEMLALYSVESDFYPTKTVTPLTAELEKNFIMNYEKIKDQYRTKDFEPYYYLVKNIIDDMKYFPVPYNYYFDETPGYMYGDSWGSVKASLISRMPDGTAVYDRENLRGRLRIVSATDGVVEKAGWNDRSGYHVGIRAPSGNYYYYAHLDKFSEGLAVGARVSAGQHIGYMGNSGSGTKENTKGNLQVHLHFSVSPKTSVTRKEFWINPYAFLRMLEDNLQYAVE